MTTKPRMVGRAALFLLMGIMVSGYASSAWAAKRVVGYKYPNDIFEGTEPVYSEAWGPEDYEVLSGSNEMLPYVQPAPDQEEAGSCLYMSLTGIAEWWLNKLHPLAGGVQVESENDLAERYFMNTNPSVNNWKTDTLLGLNSTGKLMRNRAYRFAKGWYKRGTFGNIVLSARGVRGAQYGTTVNWARPAGRIVEDFANLPKFQRTIIAKDPAGNQWGTAVMPSDIVDRVKAALDRDHAPIQVIYNHRGYWHSVVIVGYNDELSTNGCTITEAFIRSSDRNAARVERLYRNEGGCAPKGVFYVRDSIYSDPSEPTYIYDPTNPEANTPYSKRIIYREFQWLKFLANHVVEWTVAN